MCLCGESVDALQVLRGERQMSMPAEARCVVEQGNEWLMKKLVVILG